MHFLFCKVCFCLNHTVASFLTPISLKLEIVCCHSNVFPFVVLLFQVHCKLHCIAGIQTWKNASNHLLHPLESIQLVFKLRIRVQSSFRMLSSVIRSASNYSEFNKELNNTVEYFCHYPSWFSNFQFSLSAQIKSLP